MDLTERNLLETWLNEKKGKKEIAELLGRDRSSIYREIKRGTVTQIKQFNGYEREVNIYYADAGQAAYEKNRENSQSKGFDAFSDKFWKALKEAHELKQFTGKERTHNIKTFIVSYTRKNPDEKVPCFKTVYNYIHTGEFFMKPIDLPVMVRLKPRKNRNSKPKGRNKKILGQSISERPEEVLNREVFGHWEGDLVQGKKGKEEPVILTLVERLSRNGISKKLPNAKSETVLNALLEITKDSPELFDSITFDNGSEFSKVALLEKETMLHLSIYFCHAYSAWERGTNENFNKLLREFMPKGVSIDEFTEEEVMGAANKINKRIREVIDYQSAEEVFLKHKSKKQKGKNSPPRGRKT